MHGQEPLNVESGKEEETSAAIEAGSMPEARAVRGGLLDGRPRLVRLILIALFLMAAAVRLYQIDAPGFLVDRDFTSAMLARDFYFSHSETVEPWRREIARATRENQPILEPPVTEWFVSLAYRLAGNEQLRFARILTSLFWLAGGLFLFCTARALVSTDAAVFALGYYLFVPMSVLLSRSFQPDALMMLLFLASLFGVVRYHEQPSRPRLAAAAMIGAATLVYRPLVLFALLGAFVVPQMQRRGPWKGAFGAASLAYVSVSTLPALLYYGYGTFAARHFGWKLETSFRLDLWVHREYWGGWLDTALFAVGVPALLAAAIGVVLLRRGLPRSIVVGLGLGYLVFGLLFTMHIHTHPYYNAQLIPLVAIAASPVAALLARRFVQSPGPWLKWLAALLLAGIVALPWAREVHRGLRRARFETLSTAREIGRLVGHSNHVVFLSGYYGLPLQYLGEFTGAYWMRPITYHLYRKKVERELSVAERLEMIGFEPEYFVITAFDEFEKHHGDLAAYLNHHCMLKARTEAYLVYERCRLEAALSHERSVSELASSRPFSRIDATTSFASPSKEPGIDSPEVLGGFLRGRPLPHP